MHVSQDYVEHLPNRILNPTYQILNNRNHTKMLSEHNRIKLETVTRELYADAILSSWKHF